MLHIDTYTYLIDDHDCPIEIDINQVEILWMPTLIKSHGEGQQQLQSD